MESVRFLAWQREQVGRGKWRREATEACAFRPATFEGRRQQPRIQELTIDLSSVIRETAGGLLACVATGHARFVTHRLRSTP
jgi:hypothetical protein